MKKLSAVILFAFALFYAGGGFAAERLSMEKLGSTWSGGEVETTFYISSGTPRFNPARAGLGNLIGPYLASVEHHWVQVERGSWVHIAYREPQTSEDYKRLMEEGIKALQIVTPAAATDLPRAVALLPEELRADVQFVVSFPNGAYDTYLTDPAISGRVEEVLHGMAAVIFGAPESH